VPNPTHIELTENFLIYWGAAVSIYLALLWLGRIWKRRMGVRLGWYYHVFALAAALFIPANFPHQDLQGEREMGAVLIIASAFVIIAFLRRYLFDIWFRDQRNAKMPKFISEFLSLLIIVISVLIVLSQSYDQKLDAILTGSGIAAIILGLALQDLLGNLFAGFAIYFGGQFKAGDWLLVEDLHAEIVEINWRSTRLRTEDEVYLDIPNSTITKDKIINFSYPTTRHANSLEIGLDYETPPTRVKEILVQATETIPFVLREPRPRVYLKEFEDYFILYEIKFWLDDHSRHSQVMSDIRTNLWYALRRHKIDIPFPIQGEFSYAPRESSPTVAETIREAVRKAAFTACLGDAQIETLTDKARLVTFGKGERIIDQGAVGDSMFILMRGSAEVLIESNEVVSSVARIGTGDAIGEMSLLTGERRSATVVAAEDCDAVEILKSDVSALITESPELLDALSKMLARRRIQNEGIVAEMHGADESERQREYSAGFFEKLKAFFEI